MASLLPQQAWIIIAIICALIVPIFVPLIVEIINDYRCLYKQGYKLYMCAAIIAAIISAISFINIWYAPDLENFRQNIHIDIRDSQIQTALKDYISKLTPEQRYELLTK